MPETAEHLKTANMLLGFLSQDPENVNLKLDAGNALIDAGKYDDAFDLLSTIKPDNDLFLSACNLKGEAALRALNYEAALEAFETIVNAGAADVGVNFNVSWTLTNLKRYDIARDTLSNEAVESIPQAAMLKVQLEHQLGDFNAAEMTARDAVARFPEHVGLMAAVSVLALDVEDKDLAAHTAKVASNHPDGKTTIATLALDQGNVDTAFALFDEVVSDFPQKPRSWIGRGLSQLMRGNYDAGAKDLDQGAELFQTHLGTWIASGWAYFVQGEYDTARERFQTAMNIDPNFSECHGSLAVIDLLNGDNEIASRRIKTALRLDNACFSAALAQSILIGAQGKAELSRKIVEKAMSTPVNESGQTLTDMLIRMNSGGTLH
ncbi:tetratricopeptide repeat protein [Ponticaulis koreensis]|uniref:tetratricopeptide repeat protein n=1 Tax=Ponticaulis koreensis TaxID=1123045 RepID=UPI0003B6AE5F|nr:tetratricopeptide repeat protein [Ponticaulis koreensis]